MIIIQRLKDSFFSLGLMIIWLIGLIINIEQKPRNAFSSRLENAIKAMIFILYCVIALFLIISIIIGSPHYLEFSGCLVFMVFFPVFAYYLADREIREMHSWIRKKTKNTETEEET